MKKSLIIDENHKKNLTKLFSEFDDFAAAKSSLIKLREEGEIDILSELEINGYIHQNSITRGEYSDILAEIEKSFAQRLSKL